MLRDGAPLWWCMQRNLAGPHCTTGTQRVRTQGPLDHAQAASALHLPDVPSGAGRGARTCVWLHLAMHPCGSWSRVNVACAALHLPHLNSSSVPAKHAEAPPHGYGHFLWLRQPAVHELPPCPCCQHPTLQEFSPRAIALKLNAELRRVEAKLLRLQAEGKASFKVAPDIGPVRVVVVRH